MSLTTHLLTHAANPTALKKATHHPFLPAAATASLPPGTFAAWLRQDRLYALAYANFLGALLANLRLPAEWECVGVISEALVNIRREVGLFEEIAREEGVSLQQDDGVAGKYGDVFAGATAMGRPSVVGLVVLWATEECYFRAWSYARSHLPPSPEDGGGDVVQRVLIPNWSSEAFGAFVGRLRELVDGVAAREGVVEGGWVWGECERAFGRVLAVEGEFWPDVEGEGGGEEK